MIEDDDKISLQIQLLHALCPCSFPFLLQGSILLVISILENKNRPRFMMAAR